MRVPQPSDAAGVIVAAAMWQMFEAYNDAVKGDPSSERDVFVFAVLVGGSMSFFTRSWIPLTLTGVGLGLLSYQHHARPTPKETQ